MLVYQRVSSKKKTLILRWINHSKITYPPTWAPKTMGFPEVFFLNQHSFWTIPGKSEKNSLIWIVRLFGDDFPYKKPWFPGLGRSVTIETPPVLVASSGPLGSNLRGDFPAMNSVSGIHYPLKGSLSESIYITTNNLGWGHSNLEAFCTEQSSSAHSKQPSFRLFRLYGAWARKMLLEQPFSTTSD